MPEVHANIYCLNRLLDFLSVLFPVDNPFRVTLEREIRASLHDLNHDSDDDGGFGLTD